MATRRGLVIVYTGAGKGKTTAALGCALRALGQGWRVLVLQFFKGDWPVQFGELEMGKRLAPQLEVRHVGKGFVKYMGDRKPFDEHLQAAREALQQARAAITSGAYDLVILDEIIYAIDYAEVRLIGLDDVLDLIDAKPSHVHVILTGRNAPPALIARADLVTEMREIKHPYQQGMQAQPGIDY